MPRSMGASEYLTRAGPGEDSTAGFDDSPPSPGTTDHAYDRESKHQVVGVGAVETP
jgi:hypothetical protein